MAKRTSIPVYSINEGSRPGIHIGKFSDVKKDNAAEKYAPHRDDNYLFLYVEEGTGVMMVDFKMVNICGPGIFCILPGQVHAGIKENKAVAWVVAIETSLVSKSLQAIFEERVSVLCPVPVDGTRAMIIKNNILLLDELYTGPEDSIFLRQVMLSYVDALTGMFADTYARALPAGTLAGNRTSVITRQFRELLSGNYKTMKSPSAYASALTISPAYLNEAVKFTTGFPVSYWIQREVMLEAKRMLCFTDITVKEIAYGLGYEDHTYFSRLFTGTEGMSPLAFRRMYRE